MARFIKKKKEQIGQSPGTLLFTGAIKMDKPILRVIDFDAEYIKEIELGTVEEIEPYLNSPTTTWLNIDGLHDIETIRAVGRYFDLDDMILENILNVGLRPKVEEQKDFLFVSLKMFRVEDNLNEIISEQLSLVIANGILITFQEVEGDVFEPVRERLRKQRKRIRASGTDYLAYSLLDIVVDNYGYIVSRFGEEIESIEDELLNNPDQSILEVINGFKREINFLRKNIKPAREMLMHFAKMESDFLKPSVSKFLRELEENIHQASDATDSYRDILSDQLNIYHSTVSSKLNEVMKVLTIFSAIFIPITFIAGIYGTNFEVIPELKFKYGYFIMWGVILFVAGLMLLYFKRKKWL